MHWAHFICARSLLHEAKCRTDRELLKHRGQLTLVPPTIVYLDDFLANLPFTCPGCHPHHSSMTLIIFNSRRYSSTQAYGSPFLMSSLSLVALQIIRSFLILSLFSSIWSISIGLLSIHNTNRSCPTVNS